jgi:predicted acetyltransferase
VATQQEFDDRYEVRIGGAKLGADGRPDAETLGHIDQVTLGFLVQSPDPATLGKDTQAHIDDRETTIDVYRRDPMPGSMDEASPVGTFGGQPKALSWGDGSSVDTFAIRAVTVRATDRRRGILRRMMTTALDLAVSQGLPVASLTASEGTIYRRFGFGPAIRERSVLVKSARALPFLVPTTGEVVVVPTSYLRENDSAVAKRVFERFHGHTMGSMIRNVGTWGYVLGHPFTEKEPDRAVRAAVHRDDAGEIDGYLTFKLLESPDKPARVEVVDLVYATEHAYLGLWEFLLSIDLTEEVLYPFARMDDPIVHVLADNRAFDVTHEEDHVWLRVLDVPAVLGSRPYAADGVVTLSVADALGHASGTYRLSVLEARGRVERIADGSADLQLDVATLGSLLLGTVDASVLHDVGLVAGDADAAALLASMLRPPRTPHGMTYF